jgi:PAS domain S-box-containing protein
MTTINSKKDIKPPDEKQELILTLNPEEEIIQFNKEWEQLTGFNREEVLHRKFSEILLPLESHEQWKTYLDSIRKTLYIDDFVLPIKTKDERTFLLSWNGIVIKDANDVIKDICLFSTPRTTKNPEEHAAPKIEIATSSQNEQKASFLVTAATHQKLNKTGPKKHETKKILFAREKETKHVSPPSAPENDLVHPSPNIQKNNENILEKLDNISKSLGELTEKYDMLSNRIGTLEKKDMRMEKNARNKEKREIVLEKSTSKWTKKQDDTNQGEPPSELPPQENKEFTFFSDPFGFKRRHRDLSDQKHHIETQMSRLNLFQNKLITERKTFNAQVEEFSKWQEKLELLEQAIEKRRQELMKQEEIFFSKIPTSSQEPMGSRQKSTGHVESQPPSDSHEQIEEISQSAAIIQRGIIKQINTSFMTLLGYTIDEIVEKSFFDLIAQDGLADIEKYYLERLKGEDITTYRTVFLTKDNDKIPVEVNIKQTMYNDEKAEIAFITNLSTTDPEPRDETP